MKIFFTNLVILFFLSANIYAQADTTISVDENAPKKDRKERIKEIAGNFSVHGYIQSQWTYTTKPDSVSVQTMSGGYYDRFVNNRFSIRRGVVSFNYNSEIFNSKLQVDINETGFYLNDAYLKVTDPWLKSFHLTSGIFYRPFGFELGYSDAERESVERSRVVQTIFPNTRDIGAMLTFQMPEDKALHPLKINIGVFNGDNAASESDKYKDFIGQARFDKKFGNDNFEIGAGVSFLLGGMKHIYDIGSNDPGDFKNIYKMGILPDTSKGFVWDSVQTINSGRTGIKVKRNYFGGDVQFSAKWVGGKTTIRSEFIAGEQLSKEGSISPKNIYNFTSYSPNGYVLGVSWPFFDPVRIFNPVTVKRFDRPTHTFVRKFTGGYVSFSHEIMETGLEVIFKYDWYDPNTAVKGKEIQFNQKIDPSDARYISTSPADVKYQTYGLGLGYTINKMFKVTAYYDFVRNEVTGIPGIIFDPTLIQDAIYPNQGYTKDAKDDVFTLRFQFKF